MGVEQEKRRSFAEFVAGKLAAAASGASGSAENAAASGGSRGGGPAPAAARSASALMEATRRAVDAEGLEIIPTCCFSCNTACEVLAFRDKATGRIVKIEGDPSSPVTGGAACAKGLAAADLLYNPARLTKPLKRITPRSEGRIGGPPEWKEISWDEALDEIAEKLLGYRERDGARSVAFLEGTRRGWSRVFSRLANAFGAPNHGAAGWAQCLWPRLVDCRATFGGAQYPEACDYANTHCIIVWGANPAATWPLQGAAIMDARERGARLIVIDPRLSETAAKADSWIRIRPGKDTDLALGLIHVIIEENLYDARFVEEWTSGFDELRAHVADRTPELTERLTGVSAEIVRETARTYALSKPSCIFRCVTVDQTIDSVQTCRALSILMAITGNIDIPGGNVLVSSRGERTQNSHEFILAAKLPLEVQKERRGWDRFPLLCGEMSSVPSAHMPTLWETIATGEPYPVKAALIFGSNAAVSYTNAERVRQAMEKLEFIAVCDLFMTPTAAMADIVLPASSWLERDNVISSFQTSLEYTVIQQKCASIGESRSDVEIIGDLATRLGVGEFFWKDAEALYDYLLEPTGLTLKQAIAGRRLHAPLTYGRYRKAGFKTPSGKVELYATALEKRGCAPLPQGSLPPISGTPPATGAQPADAAYPFQLSSGARSIFFRHTENRRNPWLIAQCPDPVVYINRDTALTLGISENDLVEVATPTGSAWLRARLESSLEPNFVEAVPGWEGRGNINRVLGWDEFAEGIGTVPMRGLKCTIRKAQHG